MVDPRCNLLTDAEKNENGGMNGCEMDEWMQENGGLVFFWCAVF